VCAHDWIDRPEQLDALVDVLRDEPVYGIDTEFLRERTYYPRLALVQVSWAAGVTLVDPLAVDLMPFAAILNGPGLAILHAADQDLEVLETACGTVPARMFDTQVAAGFLGFSTPSLVTLAERVLGVRLSKGDRLTDWTMRPLTAAQRAYAASDVAHLLALHDALSRQLEETGRTSWVAEECEVLRLRPRGQSIPERAWWRLKDGRVLRGRDRLVAQELCAWRERRAQLEDKPVRFVLPDLAILAISQAKPKTFEDLAGARGIDGRYLKGGAGQEILDAVRHAITMSPSELVMPDPEEFDRRLRPALTLVSAWVAQLARDAKFDASLLATRADLIGFLRGDAGARLAQGWRAEVVGGAVKELVSGSAALAFEPTGTLVLEARSNDPVGIHLTPPSAPWTDEPGDDPSIDA
jgi:ribonuclease D